jgi:hypothetical protein
LLVAELYLRKWSFDKLVKFVFVVHFWPLASAKSFTSSGMPIQEFVK